MYLPRYVFRGSDLNACLGSHTALPTHTVFLLPRYCMRVDLAHHSENVAVHPAFMLVLWRIQSAELSATVTS